MPRPVRTTTKIALARVVSRLVLWGRGCVGLGRETIVSRRGLRWDLDLTEAIDLAIYLVGGFELSVRRLYEGHVRPGDVVLDLGANVGAHTLPLAQAVGPKGKVYAFEPTDFAFAKLERNLALNGDLRDRVDARQALLVSEPRSSVRSVYSSWPLAGSPQVHPVHRGRRMSISGAEIATLDDLLERCSPGRIDFVKMDVDGHEPEVLAGATKMLHEVGPPILMELAPWVLDERGGALESLMDLLRSAGYGLTNPTTGRSMPHSPDEVRRQVPFGAAINVLARRE